MTATQLRNLARTGQILPTDEVSKGDGDAWRPASKVRGLFDQRPQLYDAFVSYSSLNADRVNRLVANLEDLGVRCWMAPRDIRPGTNWGEAIIRGIESCPVFVLVLSSSSNQSRQILLEVERAVSKNSVVIPVRLEEVEVSPHLELYLSAAHWLDVFSKPLDQAAHSLAHAIQATLPSGGERVANRARIRARSRSGARRRIAATVSALVVTGVAGAASLPFLFRDHDGQRVAAAAGENAEDDLSGKGAEELFVEGRSLVNSPDTLAAGLVRLEAAFEADPRIPGLAALLDRAARAQADGHARAGRLDQAVMLARRASEVAPSAANDDYAASLEDRARIELARAVRIDSPAPDEVVSEGEVRVRGIVARSHFECELAIGGVAVDIVGGSFDHRVVDSLDDGQHEIDIDVRHPSGLVLSLPVPFVVDTRPPVLIVESPHQGDVVPAVFLVRGSVADATRVEVVVEGNPVPDPGPRWETEVELDEGRRELTVRATDELGRSSDATLEVVVDATPPVVDDLGQGLSFVSRRRADTIVMRVSDEHLALVLLDGHPVDVAANGEVRLHLEARGAEATPTSFELRAVDRAGNDITRTLLISLDETAPTVRYDLRAEEAFPGGAFLFRGTVSDRSPCEAVVDGRVTPLSQGSFALPLMVPAASVPGETVTVALSIRDAAGNQIPLEKRLAVVEPCSDCVPVDGRRGQCSKCAGTGHVDARCKGCKGARSVTGPCTSCAGTGKAACGECGGSGKADSLACGLCGGGWLPCQACDRSGKVREKCRTCNGNGRVTPKFDLKRRSMTCGSCKGQRAVDKECRECSGSGSVDCGRCADGLVTPECPQCIAGRVDATCDACGGSPEVTVDCETCEASGTVPSRCGSCRGDARCRTCDGSGKAPASK
jgi:hypothetical protein